MLLLSRLEKSAMRVLANILKKAPYFCCWQVSFHVCFDNTDDFEKIKKARNTEWTNAPGRTRTCSWLIRSQLSILMTKMHAEA